MRLIIIILIATAACAQERPDVIVIMADDMGWSDIGCYGGEIRTPNLDALAANGVRLTQFYNTGRCCPTRATLLSGMYAHQAGIGHMMSDRGYDGYRGELRKSCPTIAEVMRPAGYGTYMSGKWHVSKFVQPDGPKDNWPVQRGFERFYGTIHGAGSFYDPNSLTRQNTQIVPDRTPYYYTDAISDEAVASITEHHAKRRDDPLFMYVAHTAPHWPMHALPEDIAKYEGAYDAGWDAMRAARLKRQIAMGLIDEKWALTARDPGVPRWEDEKNKPWMIKRMEVYAAMVDRLDQGVGRIVDALRTTGRLDNTLIMFLADNGGCAEEYGSGGAVRPDPSKPVTLKPMGKDELQKNMQPRVTRDGRPVRTGRGVMPGPADTYIAYGKGWANASNTPFRLYKHYNHEGGIASPLIAHWPRKIIRKGALDHQPAHLIDLMATCMDVGHAPWPKKQGGVKTRPPEGTSLMPAFTGAALADRAIFFEHEGNRAVRAGKWKLVARGANGPWELYDMEADRTETRDLAAKHPEQAGHLTKLWDQWAERAQVLPLNPQRPERRVDFSKKTRFELGAKADLPRNRAPFVVGRAFHVSATIEKAGTRGVIVAHGGPSHGWTLFVSAGRLSFATRIGGKLSTVVSDNAIGDVKTVSARLAKDGGVVLMADGQVVGRGKTSSPLTRMPADGLQVGRDLKGAVGGYKTPSAFDGSVTSVVIELK